MNFNKSLLMCTALISTAAFAANATDSVTPLLSFRSQSQDLARQKVGTIGHEYRVDMDVHNGSFVVTPEYTRSFYGDRMAKDLFGCFYLQDCNKLNISGYHVANRAATDLLADWFYLPSNYEGYVSFEPTIQNFNADMSLYWGMDAWVKGMFFRVHAPITYTKWDLGASFHTTASGTSPSQGFTYLQDAEKFFCAQGVESHATYTFESLNCARFCGCSCDDNKTKTRLSDIQADMGWNFILDEDYNFGLFARVVAPTGTKVKGEWLFEPTIGNGRHWELGGGLTGSAILWRNAEESKHFGFYVDANVTHLFNAQQKRVFDLKDKPLSRYITAYNLTTLTYAPLANLTSCEMNVNVAVQADVTAMFNYTSKNWSYDLGYNFWARSCEKFDCSTSCHDTCADTCADTCDNDCNTCGECIIKNGSKAWFIAPDATIHAFGEAQSVVLTDTMIDYEGARTKGMSHKVFGNIAYAWTDREVVPFVGLGGFAEFGSNNSCCEDTCLTSCNDSCSNSCNDDCSGCTNVSLSQWGLWLKGGVSF